MIERSDVQWPLWRKKVDRSLLFYGITPIPIWVCRLWQIESRFGEVHSQKDPASRIDVTMPADDRRHAGHICRLRTPGDPYRLYLKGPALRWIRQRFPMTYIRELEAAIADGNDTRTGEASAIAYWEFLDIEYDQSSRTALLTAHYCLPAPFPALMAQLQSADVIDQLSLRLNLSES